MESIHIKKLDFGNKNELEEKIFKMYNTEMKEICDSCCEYDNELSKSEERTGPFSFFHIGKNMNDFSKEIRLLFVGKTSWHEKSDEKKFTPCGKFRDASEFGKEAFEDKSYSSGYWRFIRDITTDLGIKLDDIAISNLCKCNVFDQKNDDQSQDITPDPYYINCFEIFQNEVELVKPTHLIFFTGKYYDFLIENFQMQDRNCKDQNSKDDTIEVKKENGETSKIRPYWWHRIYIKSDGNQINVLRTSHPNRKPNGLIKEIVKWVQSTRPKS